MEATRDLQRQASSTVLQQRLLDIETKLASIERSTASASTPKRTESSKSTSKDSKSSHQRHDSSKTRQSHRSHKERGHHRHHEPKTSSANGQTKVQAPSTNSAPQVARVNSSSFNRTNSSINRSSSRHDAGSTLSVGSHDRKVLASSSRSESTKSILEAAEQRAQALQAENVKLLLQIAQLTKTTNEQEQAVAAAEERSAALRKELEQTTTSLANKVVFQKQITTDVVNKYEILKKDYSDLKSKFDEQVDLVESLRMKLLQVTAALSAAQQAPPEPSKPAPSTPQAPTTPADDRLSMRSSSMTAKPDVPVAPAKTDSIADNKSSSSAFKVPKSPSFFKFLTRRRNSDAPRVRPPIPAPVAVQAPQEATARGISEFAMDTGEEKVAQSYTYATDDGTESESSRADSPLKKRSTNDAKTVGKPISKSIEVKTVTKVTPIKTPLSASSAAKAGSPRRGSVGAIPLSSQGAAGDRELNRPSVVPVQPLNRGSPMSRRNTTNTKFGIIFGVKRGNCTEGGCACGFFVKSDSGSQCRSCGHFPSQHSNLGEVVSGDEEQEMAPRTTPRETQAATGSAGRPSQKVLEHTEQTKNELREQLQGNWLLEYSDFYFVEQLGKGNSSTVFLGTYKESDVALKVLRLENHRRDLDDFKKELEIMSSVRSPYIVHFYGATLEPKLVICLEYCSNGSLFHFLQDPHSELTWSLVLRWMSEAVRGIDTLHQWKPSIVHRDLKTLNLLLDKNMTLKVCDFGLSRFVQAEQAPATLFKLRGTYAYIGPEVYHGSAFTAKTDVYSLGVVLWEMVHRLIVGRHNRPYYEYPNLQHDFQIIIQAATKGLRPSIPAQCPAPVADLIKLCWNADPQLRPSCEDLIKHLDRLSLEYEDRKSIWDRVVFSAKSQSANSGNISSGSASSRTGALSKVAGATSDSTSASPSKP